MKHTRLLWAILACLCSFTAFSASIDLSGKWRFKLDPKNEGIEQEWFRNRLRDKIQLSGSLQEQGYGYDVDVNTKWTGQIVDQSWFTAPEYAKYREKGNVKVPFWLNPEKHYVGVAWYQRDFVVPADWKDAPLVLTLERTHWETTVYVDGEKIGESNALLVPHRYVLNQIKPGKHSLTIRVDNQVNIPVGVNAHSVSDHTQSNWNGITGQIKLEKKSSVYLNDVQIYPDIQQKQIRIRMVFTGATANQQATVRLQAFDQSGKAVSASQEESLTIAQGVSSEANLALDKTVQLWSEFTPTVYTLQVSVSLPNGTSDEKKIDFGLREFKPNGTRFEVNGTPIFLRGTLECCIFPLTGYPATDDAYWEKIYTACQAYGLNHVRFHSWCPPEAAFRVADRMGVYLQVECGGWANIGNGEYLDKWFYEEGDRILKEYGNHPSFCLMNYGNEPSGANQEKYLSDLVAYWKQKDNRRVYTSAAGWPYLSIADYWNAPDPRIQGWGKGLKSRINANPPTTDYDFWPIIKKDMPTVSHEIGQWCVYPDFKEIQKYTGVLKAKNFEIFQETLAEKHLSDLADEFLYASGRLQTLCYKADIEAALRTPGFAGFQLLDLHDFPGQGTALVGVLNPFWESKGYVEGEEYSMFCNQTVPLARLPKMVYLNNESMKAPLEFAHFGAEPLKSVSIYWKLADKKGTILQSGSWTKDLPVTNSIWIGNMICDLSSVQTPRELILTAGIEGTKVHNEWHIWVYPAEEKKITNAPYMTNVFDQQAIDRLEKGENVLLCVSRGALRPEKGGNIKVGFSSIFWNTAWTNKQAPHTLGVYCNPSHPALSLFPTEKYSDYQWWDIVSDCEAIVMDDFPAEYRPVVHLIDDWFTNRKLGLLFEAKVGNGKLMVCGADLLKPENGRIARRQLKQSILDYMASNRFAPTVTLSVEEILQLFD